MDKKKQKNRQKYWLHFDFWIIIIGNIPRNEVFFRLERVYIERKESGQVMSMNQDIHNFIQYLHQEKQTSENTEVSYERDLKKMILYLTAHGVDRIDAVTPEVLNSYVIELEQSGLKPATVSRSVASMKAFFHYEELEQRTSADPAFELKAPKVEKKAPTILTTEQTNRKIGSLW